MNSKRPDKPFCPERVWVLTNPHPGNRIQAIALADALGWDYEVKELHFTPWSRRRRFLPFLRLTAGLDRQKSSALCPPWPDLVIGVGSSTAPVTRWIGRVNKGRTRTVQIGRGGGAVAHHYDAVITPLHCRMPPDPRRYDTIAPLNFISLRRLSEEVAKWSGLLNGVPRPVVALLVGGDASRFRLGPGESKNMAMLVRDWAEQNGGSVIALTSRRTSQAATQALRSVLKCPHRLYLWNPDRCANPYRALLTMADALVVTGESESMLSEAAATTAPLYIYPATEIKTDRLTSRLREWSVRRAYACFTRESGKNSVVNPVDWAFAWMMRHGMLRPRRDMKMLHHALFACGRARPFGDPLQITPQEPLAAEAYKVACWLKKILR